MGDQPILDNVQRTPSPPDVEEFLRRWVHTNTPVVIGALYRGQPVSDLDDQARARARLSALPVTVQVAYAESYRRRPQQGPSTMSFGEFLDLPASARLVVTEYDAPEGSEGLWRPPPYVDRRCPGTDIVTRLFAAHAGERTPLHFDSDCRGALLSQVFGRKRVVVFRPDESQKTQAYSDPVNLSGLRLASFPDRAKEDFLRYTNAWETVLQPGETIYIPPMCWHYIEYLDTGFSFGIRFWANAAMHTICRLMRQEPRPPSFARVLLQGIAPALVNDAVSPSGAADALDALAAAVVEGWSDGAMAELRALHDRLCEGRFAQPWSVADDCLWASGSVPSTAPPAGGLASGERLRAAEGFRLLEPLGGQGRSVVLVRRGAVLVELEPSDPEWAVIPAIRWTIEQGPAGQTLLEIARQSSLQTADLEVPFGDLVDLGCLERV